MKLVPPAPPARDGKLAVSQGFVVVALRHGILSGCVMDGHACATYWPHEGRYHPLHRDCVPRLLEYWQALLEDAAEDGAQQALASGLRGAYARRAAKAAQGTAAVDSSALAPLIPDEVAANRFWRPGMGPAEPWTVAVETNVGRMFFTFRTRASGQEHLHYWRVTAWREELAYGALLLDPQWTVLDGWGQEPDLAAAPRWSQLEKLDRWQWCMECERWRWPGCWMTRSAPPTCSGCTVDAEPRVWPDDPPPTGGVTAPPVPFKRRAKAKAETFD